MSDGRRGLGSLRIVDAHCDTLWAAPAQGRDLAGHSGEGHIDLPRLRDAGVVLQFFALFSDPAHHPHGFTQKALEMIDRFYLAMDQAADFWPLLWRDQIDQVKAGQGIAGLLSIEGGEALAGRVEILRCFYRLGVRSVGLTWNYRNELADGQLETGSGGGLTQAGIKIVAEMERLGMLIDVSHLSEPGFWHLLEVTTAPIIASHSNARSQCDHLRNLTDKQIRAIARRGGVVGINFAPDFLQPEGTAGLGDIVRHIDHIAQLVGTSHIGIGADFDGIDQTPREITDVGDMPKVARALLRHGYPEEDVRGIMGENVMKLLASVLPAAPATHVSTG